MLIKPLLSWTVVVRSHLQGCISARLLGCFCQINRFMGRVAPAPGHDLDSAPGEFDRPRHDLDVLLITESRRFAGGSNRNNAIDPALDLPRNQEAEGGGIKLPAAKRGDDGSVGSSQHRPMETEPGREFKMNSVTVLCLIFQPRGRTT